MAGIIPLPSSRVSGLLVRQRLLAQLQADQLDLFRLQNQVSTGQRITLPSEDAPAARRAMTLQRLLERKEQLSTNVATGLSFLQSSDAALGNVASQLGDVRGAALGAAGTTNTDATRAAAANVVNGVIEQLLTTANSQFRGRYLFAGSQTNVTPYAFDGAHVKYAGDDETLQAYSDLGVLFSTNAAGIDVFGGVSSEVVGATSLNPQLTEDTPLSTLRGGRGIGAGGALLISDGTNSSTVDVSRAVTVGDVLRFIEANPPAGRKVSASINGAGITLQLDAAGGNLTVREVGSGKTASELGVLETVGTLTNPLVGDDLDPVVTQTTRLGDLLGAKARARLASPGDNNDVLLTAGANGAALDGVTVQLVDDELLHASPGVAPGGEFAVYRTTSHAAQASLRLAGPDNDLTISAVTPGTAYNNVEIVVAGAPGIGASPTAVYDSLAKRLTITVDDAGATPVGAVEAAIDATGLFTAAHDSSVEGVGTYNPAALVAASDVNNARGNTGASGGAAKTLYVHVAAGASSANGVIAAINVEGTFNARIDSLDATTSTQAGTQPVSISATAVTAGGVGAALDLAGGFRIVNGGVAHTISIADAVTVEDLLNRLNGSDADVYAEINASATGINIRSRLSGADLQIGENGGVTATQLGLRSTTEATRLADLNYGVGVPTKAGVDHTLTLRNLAITTRDGQEFDVDLTGAATVADAIAAINASTGSHATAQVGAGGGIRLVDHTIGSGGLSVSQSGPANGVSGGIPLHAAAVDFTVTARNGQSFNVNLGGATTVGEAIAAITASTGGAVVARLAQVGNGVELVDATGGAGELKVTAAAGSQAAEYLGLVPEDATTASTPGGVLTGADRNYLETASVFTTLIRLRDALAANDLVGMERAIKSIDEDIDRVTFARSEVGARQVALEVTQQNLEEEDVQLRAALSSEIEVDVVEAISNLTARQTSLQASLQATANILQLSLLNYL